MTKAVVGKFLFTFFLLVMFLMASFSFAQADTKRDDEQNSPKSIEELEEQIIKVLRETNTPGAAVALTSKDEILWVGAMGMADVAKGEPVTETTMFRIGSISKSFIGLTMLKLEEKGFLRLDDPLRKFELDLVNNPWEETNPILLAHLLEHTSGYDDMSLKEYALSVPGITLEEALQINPQSREARWQPGKHASYSNVGPATAARAAEIATGRIFEDMVGEYLFEPLQMETSTFFYTAAAEERISTSYGPDGKTPVPYSHITLRPSGAINVTPSEMANLMQMLLNRGVYNGESIMGSEKIDRFESPQTALSAKQGLEMGFGPGSFKTSSNGFVFIGHDGGIDGFLSSYGYLPEHELAYFCSINSANGRAFAEILRLTKEYLTRDLEKPEVPEAVLLPSFIRAVRFIPSALKLPINLPNAYFTLEAVAVDPDHQGKKVGRILLEHAHNLSKKNEASSGIYLFTGDEKNRHIYNKYGYELIETRNTKGFISYHMFLANA